MKNYKKVTFTKNLSPNKYSFPNQSSQIKQEILFPINEYDFSTYITECENHFLPLGFEITVEDVSYKKVPKNYQIVTN
jgi:hypothetical protein